MSFAALWAFLAVGLPILAALLADLPSVDLTYHLRAGAETLDTGAIPSVDTWTFTVAGQPWMDQQWGAQVILATVERTLGWTGLALLRASLVGLICACLYRIGRLRGLDPRTAAILTLAGFVVAAVTMALRPQLFGMACFALVLLLLAGRRADPLRLSLIPVIVVVWANVHGSFIFAPVLVGLAWLEDLHDGVDRPHRTLVVAIVSVLAACVTPLGPAVWVYAAGLTTNSLVTARITEWQPTSLRDVPGILFFGSAMVVAAIAARQDRAVPWPTLLTLGVFFIVGTYAIRGLAWWALAAVAAVAGTLVLARPAPARPDTRGTRRLNAVLAATLVVAMVALLPVWRPVDEGLGTPARTVGNAPSGITAALRDVVEPGDRVFNPQPWGSWFEYALPEALVAIDSRIELFPTEVWDRYEAVTAGVEGWQDILTDWEVDLVVVGEDQGDEITERLTAAGWTTIFEDEDGWILRQ